VTGVAAGHETRGQLEKRNLLVEKVQQVSNTDLLSFIVNILGS